MGFRTVDVVRDWPGAVLRVARFVDLDGGVVRRWVFGHGADGGDEHDHTEPRAGRTARAHHGRVRDHVHGRTADWSADRGRNGQADWGTAHLGRFCTAGVGGAPFFFFACGDAAA